MRKWHHVIHYRRIFSEVGFRVVNIEWRDVEQYEIKFGEWHFGNYEKNFDRERDN